MEHDERQHSAPPAGTSLPAGPVVPARKAPAPLPQLSLASLLDLTDEDLDLPIPMAAEWDQTDDVAMARRDAQDDLDDLTDHGRLAMHDRLDLQDVAPAPEALHAHDTSSLASDHSAATVTVGESTQTAWVVTGTVSDAPEVMPAPAVARPATPAKPLAIALKPSKAPKKRPDTPVANFEKTDVASSVLWPRRPTPAELGAGAPECARCRAPFIDGRCTACGHHTAIRTRPLEQTRRQRLVSYFVHNPHRVFRTLGTLLLAPGLLTSEYLAGHRRRYYSPFLVAGAALLVFSAVSLFTGLRARPDRLLVIGGDRTEETAAGIVGGTAVGSQVADMSRDALDLALRGLNMFPPLWLPLMMFVVVALIAAVRIAQRREGPAEVVYTAHFTAIFVLWWALAVPALLLAIRWGFEASAYFDGVRTVQYMDDGQIAGLSPVWHQLRGRVVNPAFHSLLLAIGLVPYAILAYRRGFDEKWPRSIVAGTAVAAVPILLLIPFA